MTNTFQYGIFNFEAIGRKICKIGKSNEQEGNGAINKSSISGEIVIPGIVYNNQNNKKYEVISTSKFCFKGCSNITAVCLPSTLKTIEHDSFYGTSITSLIIPRSVEILKYAAFSTMSSLVSIMFESGSNLRVIEDRVFAYCSKLKKIVLPSKIKIMYSEIFWLLNGATIDLYYCGIKEATNSTFQSSTSTFEVYVTESYSNHENFGKKKPNILSHEDSTCSPYTLEYPNRCPTLKHARRPLISYAVLSYISIIMK